MTFAQQIDSFEGKLCKMASQLDAQHELNKVSDRKTKRAEAELLDAEQKLRQLECVNHLPADNAVQQEQEKVCVTSLHSPRHSARLYSLLFVL